MKLRLVAGALALALSFAPAAAQVNPGTTPLSIEKGGTGAATLTDHGFVLGHGTGPLTAIACTSAQLAIGQASADPVCQTVTGDVTIGAGGVTAIGASKVTNAQLATMAANTTKCNATGGTANPTDCNAATMRTNMGVVIGTNVEAWDADLDCIAALSSTGVMSRTGAGTCSAGALALSGLATGTQDTLVGYFGSTTASATAINNCTGALTYSTSTHSFGCNAIAGQTGVTPTTATVTISIASPGVVTWNSHGLTANTPVYLCTTGALPTGLSACTPASGGVAANTYSSNPPLYYVVGSSITTNTFQLSATPGGPAINTSGSQSGTHTAFANAAACAGCIGERIWNTKDTGNGVALGTTGTVTVWNSITLTTGIWEVGAQSGIIGTPFGGGSTFAATHMHSNFGVGLSSISTAPYNGAAALHVSTNNANGWIIANPTEQIVVTGATAAVNAVMLVDYSSGTAIAYGTLWARRTR